jgi:hypothetical protein
MKRRKRRRRLDIPVQSGSVEVHKRFGIMYYRLFLTGFLLGSLFSPEGGDSTSIRNVGELKDY